jgi:AraC-like DNA-binding protein
MVERGEGEERIQFFVREKFRDVQLLCAEQTARPWKIAPPTFGFATLRTWKGHVDYRRQRLAAGPGHVFCGEPGEVVCATSRGGSGSFDVIEVTPSAFEAHCQAEGLRTSPHFGSVVVKGMLQLERALAARQAALTSGASSLELESCLAMLVNAALHDVAETVPRPRIRLPTSTAIERLREVLHSSEGSRVRLFEFARDNGVSQFQLLRGFKRRYGLPPHAYEVTIRIERARDMIRDGASVSEAAAFFNFVDQSHFARHFRRIWRVSPGDYARQCSGAPPAQRVTRPIAIDVSSTQREYRPNQP